MHFWHSKEEEKEEEVVIFLLGGEGEGGRKRRKRLQENFLPPQEKRRQIYNPIAFYDPIWLLRLPSPFSLAATKIKGGGGESTA